MNSEIPRDYNAADDLVGRHIAAGRGAKTAYIDDAGQCTFSELAERVNRFGNHLLSLGLRMEDASSSPHDSIDWPVAFSAPSRRASCPSRRTRC
jgi:benzoate-CoA ligase